jgi:hypothetical protein
VSEWCYFYFGGFVLRSSLGRSTGFPDQHYSMVYGQPLLVEHKIRVATRTNPDAIYYINTEQLQSGTIPECYSRLGF